MFTARKMFSRSLAASATSARGDRHDRARSPRRRARPPASATAASMPPTTLGIVCGVEARGCRDPRARARRPGRSRARTASPRASRTGSSSSRVVPGIGRRLEDDELPRPQPRARSRRPCRGRSDRSGSRCWPSGVGTQIRIASHSASRVEVRGRLEPPASKASATRSVPMWRM